VNVSAAKRLFLSLLKNIPIQSSLNDWKTAITKISFASYDLCNMAYNGYVLIVVIEVKIVI
jgi:hypothetical protein